MHADEIWRNIDQQRAELADLLATLDDQQWATPSLCGAWTVRDVAVHLTHAVANWPWMMLQMARGGFRFNETMVRIVREDRRGHDQIVSDLRAMVGRRRRPPGTGVADPLVDALVHGQDIAVPLGIERAMPTDAALAAADRVWTMGFPYRAAKRFAGIELEATDADFRVGQGQPAAGPISDILLVLSGRSAGLAGLSGAGVTSMAETVFAGE